MGNLFGSGGDGTGAANGRSRPAVVLFGVYMDSFVINLVLPTYLDLGVKKVCKIPFPSASSQAVRNSSQSFSGILKFVDCFCLCSTMISPNARLKRPVDTVFLPSSLMSLAIGWFWILQMSYL